MLDDWGELVLAAGALGAAAFGIVEGLKKTRLFGEAGFGVILQMLGAALGDALRSAYGADVESLLRAQYRGDQANLAKVLRQGVRIGLTPRNAESIARTLGVVDAAKLTEAAIALETGQDLPPDLRNTLGRFELAADARIDAALTLAQDEYARSAKIWASVFAVGIGVAAGFGLSMVSPPPNTPPQSQGLLLLGGFLVGLAAVPLAPIAKDVAGALKAATEALRAKS